MAKMPTTPTSARRAVILACRVAWTPNRRSAHQAVASRSARSRRPTDNQDFYGYYIWSTILFGNTSPTSTDSRIRRSGPAYTGVVGTSAATPHVAGVAALIKSMIPAATPTQIRTFIVNNVRPHPAGGACATGGVLAGQCGPGLLDANAAVRAAATDGAPDHSCATAERIRVRRSDRHVPSR